MQEQQNGVVQDFIRDDSAEELEALKEKLNALNEKFPKRRKSFLISLALLAVFVILTVGISLIQGVETKEVEYSAFDPKNASSDYAYVEVEGLVSVIEETDSSGRTFQYLAYKSANSPYESGLIKVSEEVLENDKVRAMIKYPTAPIAPDHITFYGRTREVTKDLDRWISLQTAVGNFSSVKPEKVYLLGELEKEVTTSLPPVAGVTLVISLALGIITIIMCIKYNRIKKKKNYLQAVLENQSQMAEEKEVSVC